MKMEAERCNTQIPTKKKTQTNKQTNKTKQKALEPTPHLTVKVALLPPHGRSLTAPSPPLLPSAQQGTERRGDAEEPAVLVHTRPGRLCRNSRGSRAEPTRELRKSPVPEQKGAREASPASVSCVSPVARLPLPRFCFARFPGPAVNQRQPGNSKRKSPEINNLQVSSCGLSRAAA